MINNKYTKTNVTNTASAVPKAVSSTYEIVSASTNLAGILDKIGVMSTAAATSSTAASAREREAAQKNAAEIGAQMTQSMQTQPLQSTTATSPIAASFTAAPVDNAFQTTTEARPATPENMTAIFNANNDANMRRIIFDPSIYKSGNDVVDEYMAIYDAIEREEQERQNNENARLAEKQYTPLSNSAQQGGGKPATALSEKEKQMAERNRQEVEDTRQDLASRAANPNYDTSWWEGDTEDPSAEIGHLFDTEGKGYVYTNSAGEEVLIVFIHDSAYKESYRKYLEENNLKDNSRSKRAFSKWLAQEYPNMVFIIDSRNDDGSKDPSVKVLNSYLITDESDMEGISKIIIGHCDNNNVGKGNLELDRTVESMVKEWQNHNDLYNAGILRNHTADADFNNGDEARYNYPGDGNYNFQ